MKRLIPLLLLVPLWMAGAAPTPFLRFQQAVALAPDLPLHDRQLRWASLVEAKHPFLVRVDRRFVLPAQRQPIAYGLKWLAPVPPDGWIVRPVAAPQSLPNFVRWCGLLTPAEKRGPSLDAGGSAVFRVRRTDRPTQTLIVRGSNELDQLLRDPDVWAVDGPRPRFRPANDVVRRMIGADFVQAAPWNLDGDGVTLAIWDEGDIQHPDFGDRLHIMRHVDVSEHSTHVTGTMAGDGSHSSDRRYRGVAPAAAIYSWDFSDPLADVPAAQATGAFWANNSWVYLIGDDQNNCEYLNAYDEFTAGYDEAIAFGAATLGFTFAAGNMGTATDCGIAARAGFSSLPPPGTAKNVITVGSTDDGRALSNFSSRGPTADGRVKPDVTALGCEFPGKGYVESTLPPDSYGGEGWCGTSMAAPQITGGAALLKQLADRRAVIPRPSLIKALLIAAAHPLGAGPSFTTGYGELDLAAAAAMLQYDAFATGAIGAADDVVEIPLDVPADTPVLEVTLAWDDPPAAETAAQTLVNDLELRLVGPDAAVHLPWVLDPQQPTQAAAPGENHRDNVEQVRVEKPAAGSWIVRVYAASLQTAQPFSLAGWALGDLSCDADGDRSPGPQCNGDDCNDHDPTIYPGAPEICGDQIDQNCDGAADENCADDDTSIPPDETPTPASDREKKHDSAACGCG
jgi:hypothetical protein